MNLFKCARPILFENEYHGFEYTKGGTAFIVNFYDKIYIITAEHALHLESYSHNQIRIQYRPDLHDFTPINALYTFKIADPEDTDQFDVAIMETAKVVIDDERFLNHKPYNLLEIDKFTIFNPNSKFIYRGFPNELRPIDYDIKRISQSAFLGNARYLEPTNLSCVHKIEIIGHSTLNDLDGLSGSPIFQVNQDEQGYAREAFAGMLIKGSITSQIAYFIEHKRIINMLVDIQRGNHA